MAAWKGTPTYKASILPVGSSTALATSATYTASPNANGSTMANLANSKLQELKFTVTTKGNYVITFKPVSSGYTEYLLLDCRVKADATTSIELVNAYEEKSATIYDLSGRRHTSLHRGLNIVVGSDGKTRKIMMK